VQGRHDPQGRGRHLLEPTASSTTRTRRPDRPRLDLPRENRFLPLQFRSGTDPEAPGDMVGELQVFLDAGMDGFFTDNPDLGVAALGR
jgi:glycerophosphoryl diester phosphodiesterase